MAGQRTGAARQEAERGDRLWAVGGVSTGAPTVVGDGLYAVDGQRVYRMDANTGALDWAFDAPDSVRLAYAAPAVAGGSTYFGGVDRDRGATDIYALDDDGAERYTFETDHRSAQPAVSDGTVYAGGHAVDATSGEAVWNAAVEVNRAFRPAVVDGTVYLGTNDGTYALDAASGDVLWQFEAAGDAAVTVAEGLVFTGGGRTAYAVDTATGEEVWSHDVGGDILTMPTVADGRVYYGGAQVARALDVTSGDPVWTYEPPARDRGSRHLGSQNAAPTVVEDTVYVSASRYEAVFAVDAATGEGRWTASLDGRRPAVVVDGVLYTGGSTLQATATDTAGSSRGTRVLQGTRNHHHAAAGEPEPDLDTTPSAEGAGSNRWLGRTAAPVAGSSPTVHDGVAYVTDRSGTTYAFDVASGEERWRFEAEGPSTAAPSMVGGRLFTVAGSTLYRLDPATGEERFRASLPARVLGSPTATGGLVFVLARDGTLAAFDTEDGERAWTVEEVGRFRRQQPTLRGSPTVVEGTVVVPAAVRAEAFDPATGEERWRSEVTGLLANGLTVADGTVYTAGGDGLQALDLETGERQWLAETGDYGPTTPTVAGGTVYAAADGPRTIRAHDAATGEVAWSARFRGDRSYSSPTVADGTVFAAGGDHTVYALDADGGDLLWQYVADTPIDSSPTVTGGTVFVGSAEGVHAIRTDADRSTGSRVALGTLGHHEDWATQGATLGATSTPSPSPTDSPADSGSDGDPSPTGTTTPDASDDSPAGDDPGGDGGSTDAGTSGGSGPGFGVLTALAGGAGALARRFSTAGSGE